MANAQDYHLYKARGLCPGCCRPRRGGKAVYCARCRAKKSKRQSGIIRRHREAGNCGCGRPKEPGLGRCPSCRRSVNAAVQKRRDRMRAERLAE